MTRHRRQGQAIIEFAFVFTGIVMFIYVFTKVWSWASGTIVQRQERFQATRLAAGQPATAGAPVGYQRPPLRLVGAPDTVAGDGNPDENPPLPPPDGPIGSQPCDAAIPFYDAAHAKMDEADRMRQEDIPPAQALVEQRQQQYQSIVNACANIGKNAGKCMVTIAPPYQQRLNQAIDALMQLTNAISQLMSEARDLIAQGRAACGL